MDIANIVERALNHFVVLFLGRGRGQGLTQRYKRLLHGHYQIFERFWLDRKGTVWALDLMIEGGMLFDQMRLEGGRGDGRCRPYCMADKLTCRLNSVASFCIVRRFAAMIGVG